MSKAMTVLLLLSLSFNAMFVIGYFCAPAGGPAPESAEQAANAVAAELGLDPQQRETFLSLRLEARQQADELAQAASMLRDQLCAESAGPEADPQAVAELERDLADVREVHQQAQFEQFRQFMGVLTPKQRETALKMIRARSLDRRLRSPRVLQEFDTDGDGKLSRAERAKAIQALRERHSARHEGKAKRRTPSKPATSRPASRGKAVGH